MPTKYEDVEKGKVSPVLADIADRRCEPIVSAYRAEAGEGETLDTAGIARSCYLQGMADARARTMEDVRRALTASRAILVASGRRLDALVSLGVTPPVVERLPGEPDWDLRVRALRKFGMLEEDTDESEAS